jgi:beta-glucosidase
MLFSLAGVYFVVMMMGSAFSQETLMDEHARQSLEKRVEDLFDRLTQEEKFRLLSGTGFTTQLIPRLEIPALAMADAGQGVRGGLKSMEGPATAFPSGVAMGSTWDPDLIRRVAQAIGVEARNKGSGAQVLLGPAVNIHRSPLGGRNGEYFSEDPI